MNADLTHLWFRLTHPCDGYAPKDISNSARPVELTTPAPPLPAAPFSCILELKPPSSVVTP